MQVVRRLYLYAMSGITLVVIAAGLTILLEVLLDGFFPDPEFPDFEAFDNSRERLSQAIAMLGVGTPVWAVHWRLVQRGLAPGRPERDAERGSAVRAVYLTGVLLISLIAWVSAAIDLLHWFTTETLNLAPEYAYQAPLGSATVAVVALLIWLYHGRVRRRDLADGPVSGLAASIPRLYLYGVSVGALLAVMAAASAVVEYVLPQFANPDDSGYATYATYYVVEHIISTVGWALVWFGHWTYARRLAVHDDWRGMEERGSRTRLGAFVVVIVMAAANTLVQLALAIGELVDPLLPDPDLAFDPAIDANELLAPLVIAALWAAVWFVHARWLRSEPAAVEPLRAVHQERLVSHGVAAVALAIGAAGAGWMLGYVLDVALGGDRTRGWFGSQSFEVVNWLPMAIVGLVAWAWWWRRVVARRRADPAGEANSTIRRAALFLTLGVALVAAIAATALIVYRFVGIVLGAGFGENLVSGLSTPLGSLTVAGIILAYHWRALQRDQALAVDRSTDASGAVPSGDAALDLEAVPAATPASVERRSLALIGGAGADLDAALAAVRAALPPGVELVSEEPDPNP